MFTVGPDEQIYEVDALVRFFARRFIRADDCVDTRNVKERIHPFITDMVYFVKAVP